MQINETVETARPTVEMVDTVKSKFEEIMEEYELGKSMTSIAFMFGVTIYAIRKVTNLPEYKKRYEDARVANINSRCDEIIEFSDNCTPQNVLVRKLQTENRKWLLSKLVPAVFGDKMQHDISVTPKQFLVPVRSKPELPTEQPPQLTGNG